MKKIFFISAGRSDFDRLENILSELDNSKKIILYVFLTTEYYNKFFTYNLKKIQKKFNVLNNKKKSKHFEDTPFQMIKNLSEDLSSLSEHVKKLKPDLILIAGDRYEMLLGPLVAIPNNIPTFHFFGGSITEGAIDELIRHGLTKMSHFHYTILKKYKERVLQLGEESWRVKNIGMPNLNSKIRTIFKSRKVLSKELNFDLSEPFMLLTYHPVTLDLKNTKKHLKSLVEAIKYSDINAIVTYPNSDPKYKEIIKTFKKTLTNKKKFLFVKYLGEKKYFNLMKFAQFLIGNSSSGIVESASFKIPVINIGIRQKGKHIPKNVINANHDKASIIKAIKKAKSKSFRTFVKRVNNPYVSKIDFKKISSEILKTVLKKDLLKKKFINFKKNV